MPRSKEIPLIAGALGSAAIAALSFGCGAEANPGNGVSGDPDVNPNATQTLSPSEQPTEQLINPSVTSEPESTATEEIALTPDALRQEVIDALGTIPETQEVKTVRGLFESGLENLDMVERGAISVKSPITNLGDADLKLGFIACEYPDNLSLGRAWVSIKSFVVRYSFEKEANGQLENGATEGYINFYLQIPPNCTNPAMQ